MDDKAFDLLLDRTPESAAVAILIAGPLIEELVIAGALPRDRALRLLKRIESDLRVLQSTAEEPGAFAHVAPQLEAMLSRLRARLFFHD